MSTRYKYKSSPSSLRLKCSPDSLRGRPPIPYTTSRTMATPAITHLLEGALVLITAENT